MDKQAHRHYWVRQDFDAAMELMPFIVGGYPKSVEGAVAELKLRGLKCDVDDLESLVTAGIVTPRRVESLSSDEKDDADFVPSSKITYWTAADIDAAAEWLYENERWTPWTHFCWVLNLRYGQAVRAHRYVCARHNMNISVSFDPIGLVTVIEPEEKPGGYARVQFYPKGTQVQVKE